MNKLGSCRRTGACFWVVVVITVWMACLLSGVLFVGAGLWWMMDHVRPGWDMETADNRIRVF